MDFSSYIISCLPLAATVHIHISSFIKNNVDPKLYTVEQVVLVLYLPNSMKLFRSLNYVTGKLDSLKKGNSKPNEDVLKSIKHLVSRYLPV